MTWPAAFDFQPVMSSPINEQLKQTRKLSQLLALLNNYDVQFLFSILCLRSFVVLFVVFLQLSCSVSNPFYFQPFFLFLMLCTIVTFLFLFGSPDIDGQFAFSGVLSQSLLLLLILQVLFGFVTK